MKIKLSLVQTTSGKSWEKNFNEARKWIEKAVASKPDIISLPEVVNLMDRDNSDSIHHPENKDPSLAEYRALATEYKVHLHIGSLGITSEQDPEKQLNRSFLINPNGKIIAKYDKIHLFDVKLSEEEWYKESSIYEAGTKGCLAETFYGKMGLTICYDLRFPYLYRSLAQEGAMVIFVPAAFTVETGKKHWHHLLRSRAIECRAFIVAAAQGGKHEDGRSTFGHSMVVSPDGAIVGELAHDRPGVLNCEIDLREVLDARQKIPSLIDSAYTMEIYQDPDF